MTLLYNLYYIDRKPIALTVMYASDSETNAYYCSDVKVKVSFYIAHVSSPLDPDRPVHPYINSAAL